MIIAGLVRGWRWVRNPWFRFIHLGAIGIVVIQAWLNVICPLTIWENNLREKAGEATYAGSFIQHWLHKLIFYQAEAWVFTLSILHLPRWWSWPGTWRRLRRHSRYPPRHSRAGGNPVNKGSPGEPAPVKTGGDTAFHWGRVKPGMTNRQYQATFFSVASKVSPCSSASAASRNSLTFRAA